MTKKGVLRPLEQFCEHLVSPVQPPLERGGGGGKGSKRRLQQGFSRTRGPVYTSNPTSKKWNSEKKGVGKKQAHRGIQIL